MSWLFIVCCLTFALSSNFSEGSHEKNLPSAVIVGTVYCDTCFQEEFSRNSHFISGASVAVECKEENSKPGFRQEVKTDKHGEFKVDLPVSVSKHVKKIKRCSVKLLSSSEPYCAVASTATSSSIHLKSRKEGTHIFSAGFFTFKPSNQPSLCNQKPSIKNSNHLTTPQDITFPPPLEDPITPSGLPQLPPLNPKILPPIPLLPKLPPLPQLPSLPPLPTLPLLPPIPGTSQETITVQSRTKEAHPQNFLPTPSISPPNPFQSPSLFSPIPVLTPPSPLIPPLPPIPGLTPPASPPPAFTVPLPPLLPLPPTPPIFPGVPPVQNK